MPCLAARIRRGTHFVRPSRREALFLRSSPSDLIPRVHVMLGQTPPLRGSCDISWVLGVKSEDDEVGRVMERPRTVCIPYPSTSLLSAAL